MIKTIPLYSGLLGIIICSLPHWLNWIYIGKPVYFADSDDTALYLTYASFTYHNHVWNLIDPIKLGSTFTPWMQLVPGAILAKIFLIPPIYISFIWRIFAGFSIGISIFYLLNNFIKKEIHSLALCIIFLFDCGIYHSQIFLNPLKIFINLVLNQNESLFNSFPHIFLQWRIITPGLSLFFVFVHIVFFYRAYYKPAIRNVIYAGLSYGILFYVYFYFWTAITLSLILFNLFFFKKSAHSTKIFLIGIITGFPALILGYLNKKLSHPDSLPRLDFFMQINNFSEFLFPKFSIIVLILCTIYCFYYKKKEYIYLLLIPLSSLLLLNHQIITGLQIQNFHYQYLLGPSSSILFLIILYSTASQLLQNKYVLNLILLIVIVFELVTGTWLRYLETNKTADSVQYLSTYLNFSKQNKDLIWKSNKIIAGDNYYTTFSLIENNLRPLSGIMSSLSPLVNNDEWSERIALNEYLKGLTLEEFTIQQKSQALLYHWGKWARDTQLRDNLFAERILIFSEIRNNPIPYINKYNVHYIASPKMIGLPSIVKNYSTHWNLILDDSNWNIWEKNLDN